MSVKSGKLLSGEDLLQSHMCTDRSLPKVGGKEFRPTGSWLEKKQIQTALDENKQLLEEERVEKLGALAQADWYEKKKLAEVTKKVGKFFQTMGFEKGAKLYLYPEEALYLLEMNCLQLNNDGVPLSIQQAYSLLLSPSSCSLKEYRTYSHLTKQGYRLLRYSKTGLPTNYEHRIRLDQHIPHKRVFPEVDVGQGEQITEVTAAAEENPVEKAIGLPACAKERQEDRYGSSGKSENTGGRRTDVSGPMKDFAKSVANMGKSLMKTEKCDGSQRLGLENLRQKILDMLENHFQGQISQEAMDAVSLSATEAILVHVEDVDCENLCASDGDNLVKSENTQDAVCKNYGDSSPQNTLQQFSVECRKSRTQQDPSATSQRNPGDRPSQESAVSRREENSEKSGDSESGAVSTESDFESEGAFKRSHDAGSENVPIPEDELELRDVPLTSGGLEAQELSNKINTLETEEGPEKSGNKMSEDLSKKNGPVDSEGSPEKNGESRELAEKSGYVESENTPEKNGHVNSEKIPEEGRHKDSEKAPEEGRHEDSEKIPEEGRHEDSEKIPEEGRHEDSEKVLEKSGLDNLKVFTKNVESETNDTSKKNENEASEKGSEKSGKLGEELNKTDSQKTGAEDKTGSQKTLSQSGKPTEEDLEKPANTKRIILVTGVVGDEEKTEKDTEADNLSKEHEDNQIYGSEEKADSSDDEASSVEDTTELREIPVESYGSQVGTQENGEESSLCKSPRKGDNSALSDSDETESEILEYQVFDDESMQVDDDVVEIEDPNSWKNIKVKATDRASNKRRFPDSNGWRSFKESNSDIPNKKAKHTGDDEVDIIAVNTKDIEVIDISEDSCVKVTKVPKEEIEVVDLDESESDSESDSSEETPDVKQEKVAQQRPKVASAFERARDTRRKHIMDSFPNMINTPILTVPVPQRHLIPPNVNPVQSSYTIQRRALHSERPHRPRPQFHQRRYFNPNPRYNHYNDRHNFREPNHFHRYKPPPPINSPAWQGMITPAAMLQMITSIMLPMFRFNNVGSTFMGQPQWNQNASWQQRNWQNNQPPRWYQPREKWNNNRFNRPWQNRNLEKDEDAVPERPKRPALLPRPGPVSPTPGSWNNSRMLETVRSESTRPKRPFLFDNNSNQRIAKSSKELLTDIEDELCWEKIKNMNDESDSDSEEEVTITPIQTPRRSSELQPLLRLDQCTNSASMMESLQVIQKADPKTLTISGHNRFLKISYDMFQPNVPFKKSSPPTPNFRLCVMAVDEQLPSPGEMTLLLDGIHDSVPLLFAIVHPGDVSFFHYSAPDVPTQTFSF